MKKFILYHFPAIVYAVAIIMLSSIPGVRLPELGLLRADKLLHFLEYALFAVLIFRSFSELLKRHGFRYVIISSFSFIMIFAILDEFYQGYIPGRDSDAADALLDVLGATLILLLLWLRRRKEITE